ncbi:hypothetical protein HYFRA_00002727 [Hymenoscyphus fraxineus]|uniref:Extracellular membrane protein CFEM domain-containing protein n=1 Tax=Hymenoscyphus fraxineus TaxID=746836 RepID=A0A9N9L824_9HELO|nr:hypothetical protein HYFRA_00005687 [Hymenoscyphus fraxineus]CAG8961184.1 hypothetical protein HYFRA_00002727 [Hymenoscyphus fraxineus]
MRLLNLIVALGFTATAMGQDWTCPIPTADCEVRCKSSAPGAPNRGGMSYAVCDEYGKNNQCLCNDGAYLVNIIKGVWH